MVATSFFTNKLTLISILLSISVIQPVLADSYLDALEAEAEASGSLGIETEKTQNATTTGQQLTEKQLKQIKEFEDELKTQLPSTYKLYVRLNREERLIVVETYFSNGKKMSVATGRLFNIYYKK